MNFDKANLLNYLRLAGILLFILLLIGVILYFYFQNFVNRSNFPNQTAQVNNEEFEKDGYTKIEYEDGNYSYYVPGNWILVDENTKSYSNILNGSSTYLASYPNNLGPLTPELCDSYSHEIKDQFIKSPIFSNAELKSTQIGKNVGILESCKMNFEATVNGKLYEIRQIFYFRKERIYQLFIQYQKELSTQKELADRIEQVVIIK